MRNGISNDKNVMLQWCENITKITLNCLRIINVLHVLTDSKKGRCVVMALVYVQRGACRNTFRLYLCVWGMGGGSESDGEWKVLSLDALTC